MPPGTKHDTLKATTVAADHTALTTVSAKEPIRLPLPVYVPQEVIDARTALKLERMPPAARASELSERANTFASSGRNVFIHYVELMLDCRRAALHSSGLTKKRYFKTTAQLWQTMKEKQHGEYLFWCQQATELQAELRSKMLSHEDCLKCAGKVGNAHICVWHARIAVSRYLDIALPPEPEVTGLSAANIGKAGTAADSDEGRLSHQSDAGHTGSLLASSLQQLPLQHLPLTAERMEATFTPCLEHLA